MGYVDDNLMDGEQVAYTAHLHWIIFVLPVLVLMGGVPGLGEKGPSLSIALFWVFLGVLLGTLALLNYMTSEFAVTNRRLIVKTGIISRKSVELLLPKVESVRVDQGIIGRMLGFGTITLVGTGGTRDPLKRIADPMAFRDAAQRLLG